jgi:hypothetical protein
VRCEYRPCRLRSEWIGLKFVLLEEQKSRIR